MSVIGRLDKQVEDVLIAPLSKRTAIEDTQPVERETGSAPEPPETTEESSHTERAEEPHELPVWLL